MLPGALIFTTKFDFQSSSVQTFDLNDITNYAGEGIALVNVKGNFKIEGPAGPIYENTNFGSPDIVGNVSLEFNTISIPNDVDGNPIIGTYTITYTVLIGGGTEPGTYTKINTYSYCSNYIAPTVALTLEANCDCATVTSTDVTTYAIAGVNPTITRTHKLFYPANLELTNLTGSGVIIQAVYPDVYTGTYTGKVTSTVVYTFPDNLIIQWTITGSDEIQNDCTLSQCTIYCGMKKLTDLFYQYQSIANFAQAQVVFNQLMQIEILMTNWINARECGKPADAAIWIQKIMDIGNFDENCGCGNNTTEPIQVIPFCGGSGGGNTVVVAGDSNFGTAVTAATVGSTTTYTVRLTTTYKNLILNALQTQDLSIAAFRAAGIPSEGRGVSTVNIPNGGGTLNLTVGVSDGVQVLLGSGTMTSSYTIALPSGTFVDGDSFTIIYNATKTLGSNNITIFGIQLTAQESISGSTTVYGVYDVGTTTWYVSITGRTVTAASQTGLSFWINGSDYALNTAVLYNNNPTYTYVNIQSAGSGSNHPPTTPTSNTWWKYIGNKSALYDVSNPENIIIDTTSGTVHIVPTPAASTNTIVLTREATGEIRERSDMQTTSLPSGDVWKGNVSNVAVATTFNESFSRTSNISIPISGTTDTNVASGGATITLVPGTSKEHQVFNATVTLAASYTITMSTPGSIVDGDHFWIVWKSICTTASNTVTIAGITLTQAEAFSGNVMVYAYYDLSAAVWKAYKIFSSSVPIGTDTQTLRYNSSGTLIASSELTNDGTDITVTNALNVGSRSNSAGTNSQVIGIANEASGNQSVSQGAGNVVTGENSFASGSSNTINNVSAFTTGVNNQVTADRAQAMGSGNAVSGFAATALGAGNTATGTTSYVEGSVNISSGQSSHAEGSSSTASGDFSHSGGNNAVAYLNSQMARTSGGFNNPGSAQKSDIYLYVSTTNATITEMFIDGSSIRAVIPTGKTWGLHGTIVGRQTGGTSGTAGDSTIETFDGVLKNVGGTVSLVNAITATQGDTDAGLSTTTVTVTADNVNKSLKIQVTGTANRNINWFAHVDLFEVSL